MLFCSYTGPWRGSSYCLSHLTSAGKLPKASAPFLNSNSATAKPSVPFGMITTGSSTHAFEATRRCLALGHLMPETQRHKKQSLLHYALPGSRNCSMFHPSCTPCLAASPSAAPSELCELLGQSILSCSMRRLAPPAPQHKSQHNIMLQLE